MSGRETERRSYVVGYLLALVLTGAAFAVVRWRLAAGEAAFAVVLALGFLQVLTHFRCFLHVSLRRSSRQDLALILFSAVVALLMVAGTLVILANQRARMM